MNRDEQAYARRNQILTIALEQFIAKGFYGTSTREIAKIAGMSSGLMFHYFKNKEALYECLIEIGCEKMVFDLTTAAQNPLKYLSEMVSSTLHELQNNPLFAQMFVFMDMAHHTKEVSARANTLLFEHDIANQCIPIIMKGQQLGQLRSGDPHALTVAFFGAIQGIAQEVARVPGTPVPEMQWILDIIRKGGD